MKYCHIIKEKHTYVLIVDDETISFQGSNNVEYFKKHYTCLGYEVEITNN